MINSLVNGKQLNETSLILDNKIIYFEQNLYDTA